MICPLHTVQQHKSQAAVNPVKQFSNQEMKAKFEAIFTEHTLFTFRNGEEIVFPGLFPTLLI